MSKRKPQFDFWTIVTIGILAVFALFLIYPLISLFVDGFLKEGTGEFTLENFVKFFGKKFYYRSLLNSLKLTVCVTICSLPTVIIFFVLQKSFTNAVAGAVK